MGRKDHGGSDAVGSLTREVPLPPQRCLWDRYDSRGGSRPGQPGAGYERKADTLSK